MGSGNTSPFLWPLVLLLVVAWLVYRRTRPQPVRPARTLAFTALIVLASAAGFAANPRVLTTPLFLVLALPALLLGLALGWLMTRQIRFWRDEATGQVWMGGGPAYVAIWLAIVALRLGVEYAAGGFSAKAAPRAPTTLSLLASDLLILSVGLWLARGYALVRRARDYSAP